MHVEMVDQQDEEEVNPLLGYKDTVHDFHCWSVLARYCCCISIWILVIMLVVWIVVAVWSMLMAPSLYTWVEVCQHGVSDRYALRAPTCQWTSNTTLMCQQTLHNRSAVMTNPYGVVHYRQEGYDIALERVVECVQIMIIWF